MSDKSITNLGEGNVFKLLLQYAIPSVIAMTAASLYNITDSIFIGQGVGALAISGLAITFPLMNLAAAFGSLVGIGAATLMSLRLGQKDWDSASKILGNVFILNIIFGLIYTVVILYFLEPILLFFGASNETLPYAKEYMSVITAGNVITHNYMGLNALLRASGAPGKSMRATIFSVIINAILTPLFIYQFHLGIMGAAIATIISQLVVLIWQIAHFTDSRREIRLKRENFKLDLKIAKDSLLIGTSPFLLHSVSSVIVIVFNQALIRHGGDLAVGAYGIINRFASLFVMIVLGINQGMQPIAGYNFGAGNIGRVNQVLKYAILFATVIVTSGFLLGELFPTFVSRLFTRDRELEKIVVSGFRIVFAAYPLIGFQIVISNFFQSIGHPSKSIMLTLSRQVIFLLPFLIIFPNLWGVKGVWLSIPASDAAASVLSIYMLLVQYRKLQRDKLKTHRL
ncbi:MAG: MATE family efflux transporter [Bacteroidales bacterium]